MKKNYGKRIIIIILLLIAFFISVQEYRFNRGFFLNFASSFINWIAGTKIGVASIKTNLTSSFFAIFLMFPILIKKYFNFGNVIDVFIVILDCLCLSSLLSCFFSNHTIDVYIVQISPISVIFVLCVITFIMNFINKKYVTIGYFIIILMSAILSIPNLSYLNRAMGIRGSIFALCSMLAFFMQLIEYGKDDNCIISSKNIDSTQNSNEKINQINTNERIILSGENTTIDSISKINEKNNEKISK